MLPNIVVLRLLFFKCKVYKKHIKKIIDYISEYLIVSLLKYFKELMI